MAAVPKKKISARRTRVRRYGNSSIKQSNINLNEKTGYAYRSHYMCNKTGEYKGEKVINFVKK